MSELFVGDVDGVRTFWVETGRPTLAATLLFRQGIVDETFTSSGWTHLLEHMCLHGRPDGPLAFNGSVSMLLTSFQAHGPADDVVRYLGEVTSWLAAPDLTSLEHERKVLAAESEVRGTGDVQRALTWRYGARGPGLAAQPEAGLAKATPGELDDLAARAFTRSNAVLVLDGPPSVGLRLDLRDGDPRPVPPAVPCEDALPASYRIPQGIVLSGTVTRSVAATFLTRWLEQELRGYLRHGAGAAYAPWSHYEPVDDTHAVVFGGSDVSEENQTALARGILDLVQRLGRGPGQSTLDILVSELVQGVSDPYQAYGVAMRAGHHALRGDRPLSLAEIVEEARAVTGRQIGEAAQELAASLLVGLPPKAEESSRLPQLRQRLPEPDAQARRYRSASAPLDASVLTVARDAIRVSEGDQYVGVSVSRAVGLMQVPDGGRHVVDEDGWGVVVEPTLWRGGRRAVDEIDRLVPAHLHVPMPERSPEDIPQPASLVERYRRVAGLGSLLALCLVGIVAALLSGLGWLATAGAIAVYAAVARRAKS